MEHEACLRALYEAFSARDADAVLACLSPDVDWPNAWEGGRVHGREGVREYWRRQWAAIDASVEPLSFTTRSGDRVAVEADQLVRATPGSPGLARRVVHVYQFDGELISRMDVEASAGAD